MSTTITTNYHHRTILGGWDLTPAERAEFEYVNWSAVERGEDSVSFLRYRGQVYDLNDTEPGPDRSGMPGELKDWGAYVSDTFFSGIVFRWVQDPDDYGEWYVIAGRYYTS